MEVKKESKVKTILSFFIIAVLGIALVYTVFVLSNVTVEKTNLDDYARSDWVKEWGNWKLDNEVHPRIDKLNETSIRFYADEDKNREALADFRLFVLKELKEPESVPSPSPTPSTPFAPLVTLKIAKTEYGLGQTLIFTGSGPAGDTAILTVVKAGGCGQNDICSEWQKIDNNGSFRIDFPTKFDDTAGTWKAYVRVGKLQSDTITFEII